MIFTGEFDKEELWQEGEERKSKLVFIGKNLDHDNLRKGFAACLADNSLTKRMKALRFAVGDKVKCKTGAGWEAGTVVKLMHRDRGMPPGVVAPYQVELNSGDLIYAPADSDDLIRKA